MDINKTHPKSLSSKEGLSSPPSLLREWGRGVSF